MTKMKTHGFGPSTHDVHVDAMLSICGNTQHEGYYFARKWRLRPSNPTALSSTTLFRQNSTEISTVLVLKRDPSRRMVNVVLVSVLTYLDKIDQRLATRMTTRQVDRHVKVPKDKVTFRERFGLVFDTVTVLEDKLEVGLRTSLDKIDRYFYETILCLL